tara:strand:- start:505 stop:819 length:315 start_codon:yes stop_codon:yes gene_type:complete
MAVLGNRVIKSIQRGNTGKGGTGGTVTINAVDTAKTMINVSVATGKQTVGSSSGGPYSQAIGASVVLTDSTTITIQNGAYPAISGGTGDTFTVPTVTYEVVEYE